VVNYGITTLTLAWTWEIYGPKVKNIKLNVTESGNGTTDILNKTRWNVERMLKMQDEDGGAWHKQTSERFPGIVMPDDDHLTSEVIGTEQESYKSTCATADLAAVAAIGASAYSMRSLRRATWRQRERHGSGQRNILTWCSRTRRG
jgi:endoglucanase